METLLHIGLCNAAAAVLLALVVVVVALLCRRPAVLHSLWLLVLLKLLTPPLVTVPLSWPTVRETAGEETERQGVSTAVREIDTSPERQCQDGPVADAPGLWEAISLLPGPVALEPEPAVLTPLPAPSPPILPAELAFVMPPWQTLAGTVWLLGSATWFGLALIRLRRFRRLLKHARRAPDEVQAEVERLTTELGMRRAPPAWLLPGRIAPMLWAGPRGARLLLPSDLLERVPAEQLDTLLIHELAHLRRGDHWVRLLEFVVRGLYWWHPVVWYSCRELREAEEQCCDAWVVTTLPGSGRTYATALVETLDFLSGARPAAPVLASGIGHVSDLKRRLRMIMGGTTPRALTWGGCLAVLAVGGFLLPVLPTWAQDTPKPTPKPNFRAAEDVSDAAKQDSTEKQREELKKLEEELKKKLADVQEAERRLQAARSKWKGPEGGKRVGITLEINGLPEQKPGQPLELIIRYVDGKWVLVSPRPEMIGQALFRAGALPVQPPGFPGQQMMPPAPMPVPMTPRPETAPVPAFGPNPPTPAAQPGHSNDDRRLDHLEKKLHELEMMIRELKKPDRLRGKEEGALPLPKGIDGMPDSAAARAQAGQLFREGKYAEALSVYQMLRKVAGREPKQTLAALAGMVRCHAALNQPKQIEECIIEFAKVLDHLGQFEPERVEWKNWLKEANKNFNFDIGRTR